MKEEEQEEQELELEVIFEPAAKLKADVIWGETKRKSCASTE